MRSVEPGDPMWPFVMREHARMMATRARLLMPQWPVFAPIERAEGLTLGEYGQSNGETTFMEIAAVHADGAPQTTVRSQIVGVYAIQPLDVVLAECVAAGRPRSGGDALESSLGAGLPATANADRVWVWVDGVRRRAVRQQAGPFTGWQLLVDQVAVTAVTQNGDGGDLGLIRLLDWPTSSIAPISSCGRRTEPIGGIHARGQGHRISRRRCGRTGVWWP